MKQETKPAEVEAAPAAAPTEPKPDPAPTTTQPPASIPESEYRGIDLYSLVNLLAALVAVS